MYTQTQDTKHFGIVRCVFLTALSPLLYRECNGINGEQVAAADEAAVPYLKLLAGVQPVTQELLTHLPVALSRFEPCIPNMFPAQSLR
jgi:hypothetical protein